MHTHSSASLWPRSHNASSACARAPNAASSWVKQVFVSVQKSGTMCITQAQTDISVEEMRGPKRDCRAGLDPTSHSLFVLLGECSLTPMLGHTGAYGSFPRYGG